MGMTQQFFVFLWVTLTFDRDIQTRPSQGPNMSSLWIWRKSVQPFQRHLFTKTRNKRTKKLITDSAKNRTLLACGNELNKLHSHSKWLPKTLNNILKYTRALIKDEFKLNTLLQQDFGNLCSTIKARYLIKATMNATTMTDWHKLFATCSVLTCDRNVRPS